MTLLYRIVLFLLCFGEAVGYYWVSGIWLGKRNLWKESPIYCGVWSVAVGVMLAINRELGIFSQLLFWLICILVMGSLFWKLRQSYLDCATIVMTYSIWIALQDMGLTLAYMNLRGEEFWEQIFWGLNSGKIIIFAVSRMLFFLLLRILMYYIAKLEVKITSFRAILLFFSMTGVIWLRWFQIQLDDYGVTDGLKMAVLLMGLLFVTSLFFCLCLKHFREQHEENLILLKNTETESNYDNITELQKQNLYLIHDLKNHAVVMRELLMNQETEEAIHYMDKIVKPLEQIERHAWLDNEKINSVLNYKLAEAQKYGIQVTTMIERFFFEEAYTEDLIIILSNLLDNAMEAARKCEEEKRWIKLIMKQKAGIQVIKVENSYQEKPIRKNEVFATNKQGPTHGLGMMSVKEKVEKNGGVVEWKVEEKEVKAIVTFFNDVSII